MERPMTNHHFDLNQDEIVRILKLYALNRCIPLGHFSGFTRLRQLLILLFVHRFGKRVFRLIIPHEDRLTRVYRRLRKARRPAEPASGT